ncbi:MAG: flippase-like domain-containing protein [Sphingomonadaceae bacterium]|nr:flippase-like domain-containing protein [Sphingomonadaceae bacterium]
MIEGAQSPGETPERKGRISRHAIRVAMWALPLAVLANIAFFLWTLDGRRLSEIIERPSLIFVAIGLAFVPWITNIIRMAIWCRFLEIPLSLRQNARVMLGTVLGNAITPTATGSTVIRWGFLVNEGVPADRATTVITVQTAEDTVVIFGTMGVALTIATMIELPAAFRSFEWISGTVDSTLLALGFVAGLVALLCLLAGGARGGWFGARVKDWVARAMARLAEGIANVRRDWGLILRHGKSVVAASMALAVLQWIARYSVATAVIGFAGAQMLPLLYLGLQWLVFTFSTVVPTPGGMGGTEAAFLLLYAPFVPPDRLGPVMVIWRLVLFYGPVLIAALIFMGLRGRADARPV